ncbi:MAG TPA: hypothetical protein VFI17_10625 [Solirubrobacterales bacterium]|nr:hypothetical protein [Solirubrobacterales bacterium]
MALYDNPAGRLHALLVRLGEQPNNISILGGWAAVLDIDEEDVVLQLGRIADLVRQTEKAVEGSGAESLASLVIRFRSAWTRAIFPQDHAFTENLSKVRPGSEALETLGAVSEHLHLIASEGETPDDEQLESLSAELRDVIDAVGDAEDIPDEVKHLIISRLRDVEEAIAHLGIGGPRAVQSAIEAVMGSVVFTPNPKVWKSAAVQKLWVTLRIGWTLFAASATAHAALDAWGDMIQTLNAGAEQEAPERIGREVTLPEEAPPQSTHE